MLKNIWERLRLLPAIQYFSYLGLVILGFFFFLWKLGSLTPGLSSAEAAAMATSKSLTTVINSPVYEPFYLLQYTLTHFFGSSWFYLRLPSVLLTIGFIWAFYYFVRSWFGRTIAVFASLLAFSTPLLILSARSATPTIMLLSPVVFLAIYTYLEKTKKLLSYQLLIFMAILTPLMYVPGMMMLLIAGIIYKRKQLVYQLRPVNNKFKYISGAMFLLLIAPLVYGLVHHPEFIKSWLLLPEVWTNMLTTAKQLAWSVLAIFFQTPRHIDLNIARLPLLDVTEIILIIFGGYAMYQHARKRISALLILILFSIVAAAINQNTVLLLIGLPAFLIFMAAGLRYLLVEWKAVFPKNPIPKYFALIIISLIVGTHLLYGFTYGLSAWPKTEATKSIYVIK